MEEKIPSMVVQFLKKQESAQARIATIAGVSKPYVSMAINGKKPFSDRLVGAVMIYQLEMIRDLQFSLTYLQSEEYRKKGPVAVPPAAKKENK